MRIPTRHDLFQSLLYMVNVGSNTASVFTVATGSHSARWAF